MQLDLYLDFKNGNITLEQYQDEMNSCYYRNGIWQLTKDNFKNYLRSDSVVVLEKDELKALMLQGFTSDEAVSYIPLSKTSCRTMNLSQILANKVIS